jgi:ribosomal protein L11 methyltransferase
MPAPPLWKASVIVPKERAGDVAALLELVPSPAPQAVLIAEDPFAADATVEALYDSPPDEDLLSRLAGYPVGIAPLPDQDWICRSQEGLPPVRAGRFFVYGAHDAGTIPHGLFPIRIEAGLAFGTGHHETTALCLTALSQLARGWRFRRVLDLGCGTGVLAIATAKLMKVCVLASDIDPVAVAVARDNARANGVAPLIRTAVAEGLANPAIRAAVPFDLVLANILAQPLAEIAPALSRALARGGIAVLSGLLSGQERLVLSCYRAAGMHLRRINRDGPWSALVLERPSE